MATRRVLLTIAGSLTLCTLLWTAARSQQNSLPPMLGAVLSGRDAYILQPPEMIVAGNVTQHEVSTNGAYVLATRQTPPRIAFPLPENPSASPVEISVSFWDTVERKGGVLWRGTSTEQVPVGLNIEGFLHDTNLAFLRVQRGRDEPGRESQSQILLVNLAKRTVRELVTGSFGYGLILSQSNPRAALFSKEEKTMRIIRADGTISQNYSLSLPDSEDGFVFWTWQQDGKNLLGRYVIKDENQKPKRVMVLFNSDTGVLTPFTAKPEYEKHIERPPMPILVRQEKGEVKRESTIIPLTPLWLVGTGTDTEGQALITPDGSRPEILPRAVLYFSDGSLYAAPLQHTNREAYIALRRQHWRIQAMTSAKQIGLGMMMYAQDYDENFPSPDSNLKDIVDPYLKNQSLWNNPETGKFGFQVAYKQTSLSAYQTPANTPLGYLNGPGGRAVIYIDGHVRWEDSP